MDVGHDPGGGMQLVPDSMPTNRFFHIFQAYHPPRQLVPNVLSDF